MTFAGTIVFALLTNTSLPIDTSFAYLKKLFLIKLVEKFHFCVLKFSVFEIFY